MNSKLALNVTKIVLILLGAAGLGGYSYTNHEASKRGYEALAAAVNQSVLVRLDRMEIRLDALEQKAASAIQPASLPFIKTPILPGPSKGPYDNLRKDLGTISKALMTGQVRPVAKAPPVMKAPAPPAPMKKAPMRVPARLGDVR